MSTYPSTTFQSFRDWVFGTMKAKHPRAKKCAMVRCARTNASTRSILLVLFCRFLHPSSANVECPNGNSVAILGDLKQKAVDVVFEHRYLIDLLRLKLGRINFLTSCHAGPSAVKIPRSTRGSNAVLLLVQGRSRGTASQASPVCFLDR